jgi:hypothetical protein
LTKKDLDDNYEIWNLISARGSLDVDADFVDYSEDNCPVTENSDQSDADGDGKGDVCDPDDDGDGILDENDACLESNIEATIIIDGCDSGVENQIFNDGCTMSDIINKCAIGAVNHGKFVSCVSHLTNNWKKDGLIRKKEKRVIIRCAAKSNHSDDTSSDDNSDSSSDDKSSGHKKKK